MDLGEVSKMIAVAMGPLLGSAGLWAWLSTRTKAKADAPAAITSSNADLVAALKDQTKLLLEEHAKDRRQLKGRVDRQGKELTRLGREVAECHRRHAHCEGELANLREHMKREIDKLMAEPVAGYVIGEPHQPHLFEPGKPKEL